MHEHLKLYETAARLYCEKIGVDPDATVRMPHPLVKGALVDSPPMWHDAAEQLFDLSMMLASMKEAANASKVIVQ